MPGRLKPPTLEDFLELVRRTTDPSYHEPIFDDPRGSIALYRAFARMFQVAAQRAFGSAQASFFLSHALAGDQSATSARFATFDAELLRTIDLHEGRIAEPGSIRIDGIRGRRYFNVAEIEWAPFDPEPQKTVTFRCEAPGYAGNLDHVADANGKLTDPTDPDVVWSYAIGLGDQSLDRTGIDGSLFAATGSVPTKLRDAGTAEAFGAGDVGLYVKIEAAANPENVGRVLRVVGFEQLPETPPGSGRRPRQITIDDGPQRTVMFAVQSDDGGAFTDETDEANSTASGDVTLMPTVPVAGDAWYAGSATPFSRLSLVIATKADATALTIVWEYWNGSWTAIPGVSDTSILGDVAFAVEGRAEVELSAPADWVTTTVNGKAAYYIRARLVTATAVTQAPIGTQCWTYNPDPLIDDTNGGVSEIGELTWSLRDWGDLGFDLVECEAATGGRDNDLFLLGDARGVYQQSDERDEDFARRAARLADQVSPNAIVRAVNRALHPFGYRGLAFDVGPGDPDAEPGTAQFEGFFWDVDFYDYYEDPSDDFPESPYRLLLSHAEAYGWFFVILPFLGDGDFGMFYDDGPVAFMDDTGQYTGPAYGLGFYDGFPVGGYAAYRAIISTVQQIKGGFIGFTALRDTRRNEPPC